LSTHRSLAVAALVAAPILPLTIVDGAEAAPAAVAHVVTAAKPHLSDHQKHVAAVKRREHLAHLAVLAARKAATSARAKLLRVAASYKGVPYVYGGASRAGVDCSGYVGRVYFEAIHKKLARTVSGLRSQARITRTPRPGDIVFYAGGHHVALVAAVSRGKVTNTWVARHTGTRVQQQKPYTTFVVGAVI
jgi:cell wall-associated NlpC family hydrolase